ncbi:CusB/HlyD membrane fusion family barrel-sandwich protein [Chitinophaga niastensis]|uniref:CusB/HlyD membrane fusion family barrel-sandwich protein n=1 Tax=Chitinophaga niastensis TaxID=536980 RepID=A0A2P8HNW3_CHINA|nr:HlyD family efflux transporter periplasmic adaptor subunit [Chitinophaga niastensis]PSL47908.1 CusB/HlyD membrane fusion family barrel-sandwich protein [Chitinophaga niastensis]
MKLLQLLSATLLVITSSCHTNAPAAEEKTAATGTPVTVANPETGNMEDAVVLNATSSFLLKTYVKAVANGYLQAANIKLGQHVTRGQLLFSLKTKEAENLGNTINKLDSSFRFTGLIPIKAPGNGYITQLATQAGNYVQDGEQLATISDDNSFVFVLNLPYELTAYIPKNNTVEVLLPDGQKLPGHMESPLPTVDSVSQTQNYVIRVHTTKLIPENLIAKVRLLKSLKPNAVFVPKAAVLSNESQSEYWIMKMLDSTTAVKVPIQKGMESDNKIEVLSPPLTAQDKILISGNYGLSDTATVSIVNK